ncbi:MAG: TetR/AcrR family transcriptional regulator [Acidobacteria bacterium]|nr:TetR/AcrR family transcriptional regulator [Acidobacteriota bacterium]
MTPSSPSNRSKEEVVAEFRRQSLLDAACKVFGEKGFDAATMDAIAEAAGVAKGTIYLYYPSKQVVYEAVFAAGMTTIEDQLTDQIAKAATAREAIGAFVRVRGEYFEQHPEFFRVYVGEVARQLIGLSTTRDASRVATDRQIKVLQHVIEKAVGTGEVRAVDPAAAALVVFDLSKGQIGRRLLHGSTTTVESDIAFLTDLIWSGLQPARGITP